MGNGLRGGLVAAGSALAASVCCLLPLTLVRLGLSSGAFITEVTFKPGRAVVRYDPAKVTVEPMVEAARRAGVSARRLDGERGG